MKQIIVKIVFLFLLLVTSTQSIVAQGCSQCKLIPQTNMESGEKVANMLNPAILYLMAVPYIILILIFWKQLAGLLKNLLNRKAT